MVIEFWGVEFKVNVILGCIGGFLIAVLSSMFGFGGGPFMVPLMTVGLGLPMYVVVGSSLLAIFFNTVVGSVRHF
ncbi:MAG: TSUP family transporter, partial [Deltaproteobacteria bacterium]|nr:TSUP family transporter [Deltaproteobacteria bacterium]